MKSIHEQVEASEQRSPVYTVEFTWGNEYGDKVIGVRYLKLNVESSNKFQAALLAWNLVEGVVSGEPDKMNVTVKKECR